MVEKW